MMFGCWLRRPSVEDSRDRLAETEKTSQTLRDIRPEKNLNNYDYVRPHWFPPCSFCAPRLAKNLSINQLAYPDNIAFLLLSQYCA